MVLWDMDENSEVLTWCLKRSKVKLGLRIHEVSLEQVKGDALSVEVKPDEVSGVEDKGRVEQNEIEICRERRCFERDPIITNCLQIAHTSSVKRIPHKPSYILNIN